MQQTTLKFPVEISGTGLHTGKENTIRILPTVADTGIIFRYKNSIIESKHSNVCTSILCSSITNKDVTIYTVEHLLATLYALGIDNAIIDTETEEIPILDGSAGIFTLNILEAGIKFLPKRKKKIIIRREISTRSGDAYAIVRPSDSLKIKFTIDFKSKVIGKQSYSTVIDSKNFVTDIAPARTFCELKDIDKMRSMGLIKGGSLDNAIVVDDLNIINDKPLRYINEFVRHKILDAIGDISLIGYGVSGEFEFFKTGHNFNHRLISDILSNPANYEVITTDPISNKEEEDFEEAYLSLPSLLTFK